MKSSLKAERNWITWCWQKSSQLTLDNKGGGTENHDTELLLWLLSTCMLWRPSEKVQAQNSVHLYKFLMWHQGRNPLAMDLHSTSKWRNGSVFWTNQKHCLFREIPSFLANEKEWNLTPCQKFWQKHWTGRSSFFCVLSWKTHIQFHNFQRSRAGLWPLLQWTQHNLKGHARMLKRNYPSVWREECLTRELAAVPPGELGTGGLCGEASKTSSVLVTQTHSHQSSLFIRDLRSHLRILKEWAMILLHSHCLKW